MNYDPTADYFSPEHRAMLSTSGSVPSTVTFATDFSIEYFHTFKVLRNLKTSKVYVLHQCGAGNAPLSADLPADAVNAPVFTVPVQSWSTGSTTSLAYMELLGLINKAALINPQYASSSCLLKLGGCDVITGMASGGGEFDAWANATRASTSALHLEGGSYSSKDVDFTATSDPGALARVEWIKYLAAFFNLEPHANRVFAEIKAEFEQTTALTAAAVAGGVAAPKVLWISTASTGQYASPATISTASYKMDFVKAAGGVTPAAADLNAHCTADTSTAHNSDADIASGYVTKYTCTDAGLKAVLAGIDVVIDETYQFGDGNTYTNDTFVAKLNFSSAETAAVYPFLAKVLRHDRRMANTPPYADFGSAWYEDAIPRADITADDLAFYLHPSLMSTHTPRFLRNIAAGETVTLATAEMCADPYATCPGETAPISPPMELNICPLPALCVVAEAPKPDPFALDVNGCLTNFDPTADYFSPEHRAMISSSGSVPSTVAFATDFSIEYFHTFKVLRNLKTSKVYVLHQCGAGNAPLSADLPADA